MPRVVILSDGCVKNSKRPNYFAIRIRKHGEGSAMSVLVVSQCINFVIAEDIQLRPGSLEVIHSLFQLDQLGTARRSPNC